MHRDILHDVKNCIETIRVMEQNKTLKVAMKVAYFDWSVHGRKLVSLLQPLIECGLPYSFHIIIYSRGCPSNHVIVLQIGRGKSEHARILDIVTTTIGHWGDWDKKDGYFGRCEEISKLKDYRDFHVAREQYK
jgi:hypothetical protein